MKAQMIGQNVELSTQHFCAHYSIFESDRLSSSLLNPSKPFWLPRNQIINKAISFLTTHFSFSDSDRDCQYFGNAEFDDRTEEPKVKSSRWTISCGEGRISALLC